MQRSVSCRNPSIKTSHTTRWRKSENHIQLRCVELFRQVHSVFMHKRRRTDLTLHKKSLGPPICRCSGTELEANDADQYATELTKFAQVRPTWSVKCGKWIKKYPKAKKAKKPKDKKRKPKIDPKPHQKSIEMNLIWSLIPKKLIRRFRYAYRSLSSCWVIHSLHHDENGFNRFEI